MISIQWPLVLFSLLVGTGGFVFAAAGISDVMNKGTDKARFTGTMVGIILMVVGGCCSLAHLALPENVMAAVTNIGSFSGISIELVLLGITCILAAVYAVALKRSASRQARTVLVVTSIAAAVLLAFFCGHGYVMPSRPLWNTNLLPFAYLGTAFVTGVFLFSVIQLTEKGQESAVVGSKALYLIAGAVAVVSVAAYVVYLGINDGLGGGAMMCACLAIVAAVCTVVFGALASKPSGSSMACVAAGAVAGLVSGLSVRVLMWLVSSGYLGLFHIAETTRILFF